MRIITGKFKGRTLTPIQIQGIRPATDRVKSTIFNMLQNRLNLKDADVLDLFAGSGNLGFEALSRGAKQVVFVDDSNEVLDIVEKNAKQLNCLTDCSIIQRDAEAYIEKTYQTFDLIFADPPYAYERTAEIPRLIFERGLLKSNGYLIIEHSKHTKFIESQLYRLEVQKAFGNTRVSFLIHPIDKGDEK
ncbi:MAG: 16S rRNA (guanine(966)-N(2))-methyltransferase RsmD [Bacteroidota bacterium]|nr:16S rRNA (guanine(966)-N(2))-methyltransferase RsmD [Bacteroidota bacterium]